MEKKSKSREGRESATGSFSLGRVIPELPSTRSEDQRGVFPSPRSPKVYKNVGVSSATRISFFLDKAMLCTTYPVGGSNSNELGVRGVATNVPLSTQDAPARAALVDPGADYSGISSNLAKQLENLLMIWNGLHSRIAGGHLIAPTHPCTAGVNIQGCTCVRDFIVLPD